MEPSDVVLNYIERILLINMVFPYQKRRILETVLELSDEEEEEEPSGREDPYETLQQNRGDLLQIAYQNCLNKRLILQKMEDFFCESYLENRRELYFYKRKRSASLQKDLAL